MFKKYLIVGVGGFLGAIARYELGGFFKVNSGDFPAGTFLINLTGSLVLGLFLTLISEKYILPVEWRLFFATGFVGAYTTFSSFSNEVITLFRQGYWTVGLLYSVASLVGGMACVWLGFTVARMVAFGRLQPTPGEEAEIQGREKAAQSNSGQLPLEERNELDIQ